MIWVFPERKSYSFDDFIRPLSLCLFFVLNKIFPKEAYMSKSRCSLPKNARLQVVLSLLEQSSGLGGLRSTDVFSLVRSKGIQVSFKTILRDLNELSLYYPITDEKKEGQTYWMWAGDKRQPSIIDKRWQECFLDFFSNQNAKAGA